MRDQVRRDIPATVAEIEERSDGVLVRVRAEDLSGAARMLAAVSWAFVILKPAELTTALREHAQALLQISTRCANRRYCRSWQDRRFGRGRCLRSHATDAHPSLVA